MDTGTRKYGLLLVNMGGPLNNRDIFRFLYRLFSDPYILQMPRPFRVSLALLIAFFRKKTAAAHYDLIGGKSPLDRETAGQSDALEKMLGFPVRYAMRYSPPHIETAHLELIEKGVTHLQVLPLYPQYTAATTGSALEYVTRFQREDVSYSTIPFHYDYPAYTRSMRQLLESGLDKAEPGLKSEVLFVAHSIPMKQVKKGDPYVQQVKDTVTQITEKKLTYPHSLAFQSRVGPVQWQGPSLEEALERLVRENVQQLVVQPVSFACENLETLYDLDIVFEQACREAGIEKYIRIPASGLQPDYITALASLVGEKNSKWEKEDHA
ncbi:MAG: ferrochelatase [bacterium]|nr:ferrochelatase [bacterium]